jgi:hypothetical protein
VLGRDRMRVEHIPIQYVDSNAPALTSTLNLQDDIGATENQAPLTSFQFATQVLLRNSARIRSA